MKKRTITLEFIRHGSLSNQILSSATRYIALCGNFAARDLELHLDHRDFLGHLEGLSYRTDEVMRGLLMRQATHDVSRILASIPALTSGLGSLDNAEVVHLRLVISAPELAGLPFELAEGPPGSPSEGRPLFLNAQPRVVLTREARLGEVTRIAWPRRPRILFAYANMDSNRPVPAKAHFLALRKAIDPWIGWLGDSTQELHGHLEILPEASLAAIEQACRRACADNHGPFTHVHILAHGMDAPAPGTREMRHYLALCPSDGSGKPDPIDGQRLARALRPLTTAREKLAVVTLASCDSGRAGSMIIGGANTAHELHSSGIPFVVASQFPLSYGGSVRLIQELYDCLLRGDDPIGAAQHVRQAVSNHDDKTSHDWASIVFYAALPPDIDSQVIDVRFDRMRLAGDVAFKRVKGAFEKNSANSDEYRKETATLNQFEDSMRNFKVHYPAYATRIRGWLASAALRWAEFQHRITKEPDIQQTVGDSRHAVHISDMSEHQALRFAAREYAGIFDANRNATWALVQSLTARWAVEKKALDQEEWTTAFCSSKKDLRSSDLRDQAQGHDCLAQLELLRLALPRPNPGVSDADVENTRKAVTEHVQALVRLLDAQSYEAFTLRRQMRRHGKWWNPNSDHPVEAAMAKIGTEIDQLLAQLGTPESWHVHFSA